MSGAGIARTSIHDAIAATVISDLTGGCYQEYPVAMVGQYKPEHAVL